MSYGSLGQTALEELLSQCTHLTNVNINGCANLHDLDWERKPQPHKLSLMHSKTKLISLEDSHRFESMGIRQDLKKHCEESCHRYDSIYHSHIVENLGDPPIYDRAWNYDQTCESRTFQERIVQEDDPIASHALQCLNCVGCPNIMKVVITHTTGFWNLLSLNLSLGSNITEVRLECLRLASLNLR